MEPLRGDVFIHFVYGSRRVNIRLGVLLLIPKSPRMSNCLKLSYALRLKNLIYGSFLYS